MNLMQFTQHKIQQSPSLSNRSIILRSTINLSLSHPKNQQN